MTSECAHAAVAELSLIRSPASRPDPIAPPQPRAIWVLPHLAVAKDADRDGHAPEGPLPEDVADDAGDSRVLHLLHHVLLLLTRLLLCVDHHRHRWHPEGRRGLALAGCDEAAAGRRHAKAERCGGGQHRHQYGSYKSRDAHGKARSQASDVLKKSCEDGGIFSNSVGLRRFFCARSRPAKTSRASRGWRINSRRLCSLKKRHSSQVSSITSCHVYRGCLVSSCGCRTFYICHPKQALAGVDTFARPFELPASILALLSLLVQLVLRAPRSEQPLLTH